MRACRKTTRRSPLQAQHPASPQPVSFPSHALTHYEFRLTYRAAEDEIDWDEDDNKPATEAAAATIAAGGKGPVDNPVAVPNQKVAVDPSTTADLKVVAPTPEPTKEPVAAEPKAPAPDFSIGIGETDAEKEAKKRADRAKRFGIPEDEEAKKLAERAKKFGVEAPPVVKGLDAALPDRRPKRVREDKQGGRNAKRQTPDRRTEAPVKTAVAPAKKASGRITDDPVERKKAEERAKRFASTT